MNSSLLGRKVWISSAKGAVLPIATLLLVMLLVVPVPATLLDIGFIANIMISLAVLMVALNVARPLDFSSFPTVLLFAIATKLGMDEDPLAALSSLGLTDVVNHAPTRPGDRLRHTATVSAARLSNSRPGTGVVTFHGELFNQDDEPVFSFDSTVLVHCRPS